MFAEAFIHFLCGKNALNEKQAIEALSRKIPKVRPAIIAVYDGLLTEEQAKAIAGLQLTHDMPFGFLSVREGFLTNEQVSHLMGRSTKDDMRIIQALSDKGFMTMSAVLDNIAEFKEYYGLSEAAYEGLLDNKAENFVSYIGGVSDVNSVFAKYASVFIRTFIRCVDSSLRIEKAAQTDEIDGGVIVETKYESNEKITIGMCIEDEKSALNLAGRFIKQRQHEFGESAEDSLKEFLDIASGMFVSLLERDLGIKGELGAPKMREDGVYRRGISAMGIVASDIRARLYLYTGTNLK